MGFLAQKQRGRLWQPVEATPELNRVVALPRIAWTDALRDRAVAELTPRFALQARDPLWPIQAQALLEAYWAGGLIGAISVGGGKTLLSLLLPRVWASHRPLLLVPSKLKSKTFRAMRVLSRDWRVSTNLTVWTYESLSFDNKGGKTKLEQLNPDVIICDEAHALKDMGSARWRKFQRFARDTYEQVRFAFLSGSIMRTSLLDFWHFFTLALVSGSPLPLLRDECAKWDACIDPRADDFARPAPGALLRFARREDDKLDQLERARKGVRERVNTTRGVVVSVNDTLKTGLIINRLHVDVPKEIQTAIKTLREEQTTPNGETLDPGDVLAVWRHIRELLCGFYQRWDPPAPLDWLLKRKQWKRVEYQTLAAKIEGLDSPFMIRQHHEHDPRLIAWQMVQPTFEPRSRPFWVSHHLVDFAVEWLREHSQLVWVEHPEVGRAIARKAGCRYYGRGDNDIEDAPRGQPAVASIAAHGEGKNLQRIWHRALVTSPPPSGARWEQKIGRLLRAGQPADDVIYDVLLLSRETRKGFRQAIEDEKAVSQTLGGRRLLLRATYNFDLETL